MTVAHAAVQVAQFKGRGEETPPLCLLFRGYNGNPDVGEDVDRILWNSRVSVLVYSVPKSEDAHADTGISPFARDC